MTRWAELDGKFVDLDEVRAIELIDNHYESFVATARIVLTVPGGTVDIPVDCFGTTDLVRPAYPEYPPVPTRIGLFSRKATRRAYNAAWDARREEWKRVEQEYERAIHAYDSAVDSSRRRLVQERFDAPRL